MKRPDLLIVGYGRIGRLLGSLLSAEFNVSVLDRKRVRIPGPLKPATPSKIGSFPVVILALPIHRLESFLRREGNRFTPGTFVADVSALKEAPMKWLNRHLPTAVSYSGLHPLFGPDSLKSGLAGHSVVVCRGRSTDRCHRRLIRFLKNIPLKVVETDPVTHDKTISSTLLLTQWIENVIPREIVNGNALFETPAVRHLRSICATAANDHDHIFRDICRFSPYSKAMLKRLARRSLVRSRKKPG